MIRLSPVDQSVARHAGPKESPLRSCLQRPRWAHLDPPVLQPCGACRSALWRLRLRWPQRRVELVECQACRSSPRRLTTCCYHPCPGARGRGGLLPRCRGTQPACRRGCAPRRRGSGIASCREGRNPPTQSREPLQNPCPSPCARGSSRQIPLLPVMGEERWKPGRCRWDRRLRCPPEMVRSSPLLHRYGGGVSGWRPRVPPVLR